MIPDSGAWKIPVVAVLLLQCSPDKDPTLTTTGLIMTGGPSDETEATGSEPTEGSGERCGDGVVSPGEICDGQDGCDADCQGPPVCTPYMNYGCEGSDVCLLIAGVASCQPFTPDLAQLGEVCGDDYYAYDTDTDGDATIYCEQGLVCDPYGCETGPNGCCVRPCVIGGDPCPGTLEECGTLGLPAPLNYIGTCYVPF